MRVALVHSFYTGRWPCGENEAVRDQQRALEAAGHHVTVVGAHTDELSGGPLYPVRAALRVASGRGHHPLDDLRRVQPDIVHVHNLFPNYGHDWLDRWDGPLVVTQHNFRPLCVGGNLLKDGVPCTRCPDGDRWAGLHHGCYRGSRLASLPLALANRHGAAGHPLLRRADRVVVLSERSRLTYLRAGVPERKLALVLNSVPAVSVDGAREYRDAWLYVGRLNAQKGILGLLKRWPAGEPLDVVGDGELASACWAAAPDSVRFLGRLDRAAVRQVMLRRRGLVFPSVSPEASCSLTCTEAFASSLPVLAMDGTVAADTVRAHGTGAVMTVKDPLAPTLREATRRFPELRDQCLRTYETHFSEHVWQRRMTRLYDEVLAESGRVGAAARVS
ncbi:glycosyltransferase family 4 protein [Streptomyces sp. NPDC050658]|uniref:glycosyltransferase family 4 protein n=1 Tax=unclassified Streptomyces TaxID=2593676 RepID=UPI0034381E43